MTLTLPRGEKTPVVWSIAGSDSSGGAGLQADIKTLTALGAHACTVVTSVTAQSSAVVSGAQSVSADLLKTQIETLRHDMPPQAIKIGMLGDVAGVRILASLLESLATYTVYDPVMIATSGARLLNDETLAAMRETLLPHVDLLTPNHAEAEALAGFKITSDADAERAALAILKLGVKAVLIKNCGTSAGLSQEFYTNGPRKFWLTLPTYSGEIPRGTGCTLASAMAAAHTFGFDEADAVVIGKAYVHRCLRLNAKIGKGPPMATYYPWPVEAKDFPWLTPTAEAGCARPVFPTCGNESLGFYPVVDSVAWLRRLLPLGIRTAQLRVKTLAGVALDNEIREGIALARTYDTRLFINDYWQQAISFGAYGVHLGQEDLATADMAALAASGLRLGISTHGYAELARALAFRPSYIALGPIFPTTLKSMKFAPQEIETLRIWRQLTDCPLVAIGGIKLETAPDIYAAGADSIAVVSDVTQNADPENRVREWLKLTEMREWPASERHRLSGVA